jgi:hypothetical protein
LLPRRPRRHHRDADADADADADDNDETTPRAGGG